MPIEFNIVLFSLSIDKIKVYFLKAYNAVRIILNVFPCKRLKWVFT